MMKRAGRSSPLSTSWRNKEAKRSLCSQLFWNHRDARDLKSRSVTFSPLLVFPYTFSPLQTHCTLEYSCKSVYETRQRTGSNESVSRLSTARYLSHRRPPGNVYGLCKVSLPLDNSNKKKKKKKKKKKRSTVLHLYASIVSEERIISSSYRWHEIIIVLDRAYRFLERRATASANISTNIFYQRDLFS